MFSSNASVRNSSSNSGSKSVTTIVLIGLAIILILFFIYSTYKGFRNYQKYSPYLIDGITDGTVAQKFSAYQISPSSDSQYGTEFTYSFWLFIKDTNFTSNNTGKCSSTDLPLLHVFHKGSYDYIANGGSTTANSSTYYPLLQMPGVWLYPNTNKLNIRFNTYENVVETADVGNIPLNMWVNVIIILIGGSVDVYINGNLKKRTKLSGVPKINYGDFYTSNWGGFFGYLSRLRYFNYAIQPFMVDQIFNMGPSKAFATNITQGVTDPTVKLSPNYWMTTGYPNSQGAPGYNQSSTTST
jgi:hypothetical protein